MRNWTERPWVQNWRTNFWQEQRINRALREKHNKILCSQVVTGARYRCFLGGIRTKMVILGDTLRGGYFWDMHRSSPCSLSLAFCGQVRSEHLPHSLGLQTLASKCKYAGSLTTWHLLFGLELRAQTEKYFVSWKIYIIQCMYRYAKLFLIKVCWAISTTCPQENFTLGIRVKLGAWFECLCLMVPSRGPEYSRQTGGTILLWSLVVSGVSYQQVVQ